MKSSDAYIRHDGNAWIMGSSSVERVVALEDGCLLMKSLKAEPGGKEMAAGSDEFFVTTGASGERVTGSSGGWRLIKSNITKLKQGELQLDIILRRGDLQVTKSYIVYPGSSVIREWVSFRNSGKSPVNIVNPGFLNIGVRPGKLESTDLHWMTGGEFTSGSWLLHTEKLQSGKQRKFDSYDAAKDTHTDRHGDGTNSKIMLNDRQIWPAEGWQHSANETDKPPFNISVDVKAGDRLAFVVNGGQNADCDKTNFDPTIEYTTSAVSTAAPSDGGSQVQQLEGGLVFGAVPVEESAASSSDRSLPSSHQYGIIQGENGWRYQSIEAGKPADLTYDPITGSWKGKDGLFVNHDSMQPVAGCDAAKVWTAPKSGTVRITGSVCNTGNWFFYDWLAGGTSGGSATYAPWYALQDTKSGQGLFVGWDYFGHWTSSFTGDTDGSVNAGLALGGYKKELAPGETITTPMAFTGLFDGDIDEAGNELLDWQYAYLWDYTNDKWFPAVRMLAYWMKGNMKAVGDEYTAPDAFRKAFGIVDLMRYVGGDVYHRDYGWWDNMGDYNGPDWRVVNNYLHKNDMGLLLYIPVYPVNIDSKFYKDHSDLLVKGGTLMDVRRPEVVDFIGRWIDDMVKRWGDFAWRTDCSPVTPIGDDTPLLAQDQAYRAIMQGFLDRNPGSAHQACCGGGRLGGYEYIRYSMSLQLSDGLVGLRNNYYASLLFPPDKTNNMPDIWDPAAYDKTTWRGLLSSNFDLTGDTRDPQKMEGLRELIDIYHYLQKEGVAGRWSRAYRPVVEGDDPVMFFQRMSRDQKKGIVITKHYVPAAVTIRLKGLIPDLTYTINFQESDVTYRRLGRDLMDDGIYLEKVAPGELIYLNLPMHPGSRLDKEPPTAPSNIKKQSGENMGYPGIELAWNPGTDNNWVSYYEILRNDKVIDKVSGRNYYFDHSAGADLAAKYEVRTVDGAGNASSTVLASGPKVTPADIYDDTQLAYSGDWVHQQGLPAVHDNTLSFSGQKDSVAELAFEGREVLVFAKLGVNCGKAAFSIDGSEQEVVDTYSADDIWGVCIFRKVLTPGRHTIKIKVLGEHNPNASDSIVHIDGVRVEK